MNKLLNKPILSIVGSILFVVLNGMVFRSPAIGSFIAVAACLKIANVIGWKMGAKYGALIGAVSLTVIGLVRGSSDFNLTVMEALWIAPLAGILTGGVLGAIFPSCPNSSLGTQVL